MNDRHRIHDTMQADAFVPSLPLSFFPSQLWDYMSFRPRRGCNADLISSPAQTHTIPLSTVFHLQTPAGLEISRRTPSISPSESRDVCETFCQRVWCTSPNHILYPRRCGCPHTLSQ